MLRSPESSATTALGPAASTSARTFRARARVRARVRVRVRVRSARASRQWRALTLVSSHSPLLLRTLPPCTLAPGQTRPMCETSRKPEVHTALSFWGEGEGEGEG